MEKNVFDVIGNIHIKDLIVVFIMTIPILSIFIIFSFLYFTFIDKSFHKKENGDYYEYHGLSRFCLAGIFFMFGLIIFDMIMEFISAYAVNFINPDIMGYDLVEILNQSLIFTGICKVVKSVPTNILINFTIVCTAIYTSTEGVIASLRTLKVEEGLAVQLPALKRKRLATMFLMWCYLAIVSTLYTFLIGSNEVKFDLPNVYVSVGVTLIILFLAERSPSLLKDQSMQTKIIRSSSNVVSDSKSDKVEGGLDDDEKKNDIAQNFGDKNNLSDLEKKIAGFSASIDDTLKNETQKADPREL